MDPYTGYILFQGQYGIGKKELNKLKKISVDKMRVIWSTGYEDYEVIHVDFFKNQLSCLESN